jgi:hypothetical protein
LVNPVLKRRYPSEKAGQLIFAATERRAESRHANQLHLTTYVLHHWATRIPTTRREVVIRYFRTQYGVGDLVEKALLEVIANFSIG